MCVNCYLYNVNEIIVEDGLQCDYKKFVKKLNKYLQRKYSRYYIGLQLYQNKDDSTSFTVIAYYRNIPGIQRATICIGRDISKIYDEVWGESVQRNSLFSFVNNIRIIPTTRRRRVYSWLCY